MLNTIGNSYDAHAKQNSLVHRLSEVSYHILSFASYLHEITICMMRMFSSGFITRIFRYHKSIVYISINFREFTSFTIYFIEHLNSQKSFSPMKADFMVLFTCQTKLCTYAYVIYHKMDLFIRFIVFGKIEMKNIW